MKYLLDTCAISDYVHCDNTTLKHIKKTAPDDLCISCLTLMELEYGFELNPERAKKIRVPIYNILNSIHILPFTKHEALSAAVIRAKLKKAGTPIGAYDILIASTALHHQLIVVTSNEKEFKRVRGLEIENWRH